MAKRTIDNDTILELNRLYLQIGTYAGVSRAMGGSPSASTVKKYIIPNFVDPNTIEMVKFEGEFPSIDKEMFNRQNWGELCELFNEEKQEIEELWKEMSI